MLQGLALGRVLNIEFNSAAFRTAPDDDSELRRCPGEVRALRYNDVESDARFERFRGHAA